MHEVAWALHHVSWPGLQGAWLFHNRQVKTNIHEMRTELLSLWTGSEVLVPALSLLYDLGQDSLSLWASLPHL